MYLRTLRKRVIPLVGTIRLLVAIVILLLSGPLVEAKVANVSGVIFTLSSDRAQTLWPNARITLKNLATNDEYATVSNELGTYSFVGLLAGEYEMTVTLAGF